MKIVKRISIILLMICSLFSIKGYGANANTNKFDLLNIDTSAMQRFVDDNSNNQEYLPKISLQTILDSYKKTGKSGINVKVMLDGVYKYAFHELFNNTLLIIELLFIGILFALLQNLSTSYGNDSVSDIANYACMLIMALIIIKSFLPVLAIAKDTISKMDELMNCMLPPLISMVALSGGIVSAATLDPIIVVAIKVTIDLINTIILPMTTFVVVLNIVDSLSVNVKVTKLAALIKEMILFSLGFIMTIFIGIVTIRSSMSSSIDEVALKTAKLAVDTFVPVVGKCFSDAVATVAGYSTLLRDAISIVGLLIMVFICVFPLIKIALIALIYKFAGAIMEPVIDNRIVQCLSSVGNSISILFACVSSVGVLFFIMTSIISASGKLIMVAR